MKNKTKGVTTSGRKRITFQFHTDPLREVYVSGSFNNWEGKAKKLNDSSGNGDYSGILMLLPGKYEYKFLADGIWHVDPECPNWVPNKFGTLNSLITVK